MTVRKTVPKAVPSAKPVPARKPTVAKAPKAVPEVKKAALPSKKVVSTPAKDTKPKKVKLIRDSFTMPSFDYDLIDALKEKALSGKSAVKKSELLRAGLRALDKLDSAQLITLVGTLAVIKTGRPKK